MALKSLFEKIFLTNFQVVYNKRLFYLAVSRRIQKPLQKLTCLLLFPNSVRKQKMGEASRFFWVLRV
jgi:hypothetical protein